MGQQSLAGQAGAIGRLLDVVAWKVCWFVFFFPILKFCPLSSTDLVGVTGDWSLVWGLMAGLRGFASHDGGILSGGWLWKWKLLDDPGTDPP